MDYVEMLQNCLEQMGQEEMQKERENVLGSALDNYNAELERYLKVHPY